ncbi:MAG: SsrA-binding protein [Candidatus Portnoybacteria bacterium CG_4_8_14_3_um_filter_44_15]|uniref:SsrA-binding protein n=4 Tax=Candidatus Portnoyibacteriota TaxID=1817913 RepID=A0A2M7YM69_9BACT|nr:MAG: SsrA-binding protein [Parcubacteria group bacterium CG1_02_44_65]PIP15895.1 MAG: SsrA-binding protein [Candidatus Portnoybacteria bacterium CG23_combo_of_CG06-09_8_20_14_all_44_36]PIW74586.1 MAG: SsrA-binding protein [Candidatus Portnoybacteria bacterium CG_4_8_14_3_um_filter_44_15]PIZ69719.1 MAG: SsrA-binding protein [Candidatus Portnoybacteria bacterium CG_4_10_14_0_2_um_filter_43_36]PJA64040.1 MAG: SsrA-binding protein [Candidatus Portnoybacteria bacterium CG_4_9_14_3_um_filter_43_11
MPALATNPRAKFDYHIIETYEAGLVLSGFEAKAVKNNRLTLKGSYVTIKNREAFLINAQIMPYQPKNTPADYDPSRTRKLLLHKKEIKSLIGRIKEKGLTLTPISVYTKRNRVKLEFGLGRGKKKVDKREKIKKRESDRKMERALKRR